MTPSPQHEALVSMRDWIRHWQKFRNDGLMPTEGSLAQALAEVERALEREKEGA